MSDNTCIAIVVVAFCALFVICSGLSSWTAIEKAKIEASHGRLP